MKTRLEMARNGELSEEMRKVAHIEGIDVEILRQRIAKGTVVIVGGLRQNSRPVGIGYGLSSKVNASIGTSTDIVDLEFELRKAAVALEGGADTLMELSVGGDLDATMVGWMLANEKDNPFYERFDKVVEVLKKYETVLSLGNGLRAGAIADSLDRAQIQELLINCELAESARELGCQVMVEGPGHVPLDEIETSIILEKKMSGGAPYYMLGPLVTDVGAGYDHITAAIGIAMSSRYGADLLCYITPSEHLGLPSEEDVRIGVKAAKVAAHAGDIVKLRGRVAERDLNMSRARRDLDWEKQFSFALFGDDARAMRDSRSPGAEHNCTMCGKFCALANANQHFM